MFYVPFGIFGVTRKSNIKLLYMRMSKINVQIHMNMACLEIIRIIIINRHQRKLCRATWRYLFYECVKGVEFLLPITVTIN